MGRGPGRGRHDPGMNETQRVYRARLGRAFAGPALLGIVAGLAIMTRAMAQGETSPAVVLSVLAGIAVLLGTVCFLLLYPLTTVTDEGIVVRRVSGTRRYGWSDIRDIAADRVHLGAAAPAALQVVIDAPEGRIRLPNVNALYLGGDEAAERELADLREMWARGRGQDPYEEPDGASA